MPFLMSVLTLFPPEKRVFFKEYASGAYGALSYYLAKVTTELPFNVIIPLMFSVVVYFMVGLRIDGASYFFIFYACLLVLSQNAQGLGLLISTAISNIGLALILAPLVFIPMMLFGGFFANTTTIPSFFAWLQWVSLFRYGFEILVVNEFQDQAFTCTGGTSQSGGNSTSGCFTNGNQVISLLGLDSSQIGRDFGILISTAIALQIASFLFLKYVTRNH